MFTREVIREKRHQRTRKRIFGTVERPRVCVYRSLKHLYVQAIDDANSATLCATSTVDKDVRKSVTDLNKSQQAEKLGQVMSKKLLDKGIKKIAFDRGGYLYHGRVKALAESMRQGGIDF